MNDIIEKKWLDIINFEYNKDKKYKKLWYDLIRKLDSGNYYSVGRTIPTSSSNKGINRGYGPGTRH